MAGGDQLAQGQLAYPVTEDPRDYSIWLTLLSGNGNMGNAFTFNSGVSNWTVGPGINSVSYETSYTATSGNNNITFKRGTDICVGIGMLYLRQLFG